MISPSSYSNGSIEDHAPAAPGTPDLSRIEHRSVRTKEVVYALVVLVVGLLLFATAV